MRFPIIVVIALFTSGLVSCSSASLTAPCEQAQTICVKEFERAANPWIWGNWLMHIPEDHSSIEVLPVRSADKHFNVKTLLEQSPCDNCIWISKFKNNGDGTISIDITLRHPYTANNYFTGFDVRGIFHCPAHNFLINPDIPDQISQYHFPSLETGDPELLNPDGYTGAFTPFKDMTKVPIERYQPGGDLGGTYDEEDQEYSGWDEIWPFICYYSSDIRRHFASSAIITRTYHIALPPGEWEFGYSVDACWAPPTNVPVMDIVEDFPPQANTLRNYRADMEISGPLVGQEPSTLTIRIYHHLPEALQLYQFTDLSLYPGCVQDNNPDHPVGPTFTNDEYVEFTYELYNEFGRPPGKYPILLYCTIFNDDYLQNIEEKYYKNAGYHQVLWVTVAE
jgi:hypothetical protein